MNESYKYQEYIELLKANKNLILTGAPGTGKTFLAREIAKAMNAEYTLVQFHPSYDYTDFVEGLRPTPPDKNGNIGFERKDGIFKEFCKEIIIHRKQQNNSYTPLAPKFPNNTSSNEISSDTIEKSIQWFIETMNGKNIVTHKEKQPLSIEIQDKRIIVKNSNNNSFNISPNTKAMDNLREYIKTQKYFKGKDTYVPSVGKYILDNCPYFHQNNTNKTEYDSNFRTKYLDKAIDVSDYNQPFLFIIDEINRGELSKIFGELFFCIDPGYRGKKGLVKTQYQNLITDESDPFYEGFYVPENVYIIGTMNDIDRSVESMDFAMRRRFAWKEVKANENTSRLDELGDLKNEVIRKMNRLNTAIWNEETNEGIEGLSAAYHIGGAYFMKLKLYLEGENKTEAYRKLWENHLRGVLFEYLRGSLNSAENLSMLEKVYYSENE